jgi:hypothetical protein
VAKPRVSRVNHANIDDFYTRQRFSGVTLEVISEIYEIKISIRVAGVGVIRFDDSVLIASVPNI